MKMEVIKQKIKEYEKDTLFFFKSEFVNENESFISMKCNFNFDSIIDTPFNRTILNSNLNSSMQTVVNNSLIKVFETIDNKEIEFLDEGRVDYISILVKEVNENNIKKALDFLCVLNDIVSANIECSYGFALSSLLKESAELKIDIFETEKLKNMDELFLFLFQKNMDELIESKKDFLFTDFI